MRPVCPRCKKWRVSNPKTTLCRRCFVEEHRLTYKGPTVHIPAPRKYRAKALCACGDWKAPDSAGCFRCSPRGSEGQRRVVTRPCEAGCGRWINRVERFVAGSDWTADRIKQPRLGWVATDHAKRCKKCREGSK